MTHDSVVRRSFSTVPCADPNLATIRFAGPQNGLCPHAGLSFVEERFVAGERGHNMPVDQRRFGTIIQWRRIKGL